MELLLIILAILLAVVAIAKVLKAKELVDGLKDVDSEPVTAAEIKTNALGLVVFGLVMFALLIAQIIGWNKYMLPSSASVHGVETDTLMQITMVLILTVFFITQALLFYFGYKYYFRKGRKAFWFPHNNRLEMAWTIVPATVLILLITYGMSTWDNIMNPEEEAELNVEFVSEQFKWTTRFAGVDSTLGEASFALFGSNALGIATKSAIEKRLDECKESIKTLSADSVKYAKLVEEGWNRDENLDNVESSLKNYKANVLRLERMLAEYAKSPAKYDAGKDDIVINGNEIKLPKGKKIKFQFRSKDVIHSAYFPHFRAQMNTVPGMKTYFTFEPKETSEEFNTKAAEEGKVYLKTEKDEEGNVISQVETPGSTGYILLCNKICGASHYNMKVFIEVVEEAEFNKWIAEQKPFEN